MLSLSLPRATSLYYSDIDVISQERVEGEGPPRRPRSCEAKIIIEVTRKEPKCAYLALTAARITKERWDQEPGGPDIISGNKSSVKMKL